MLLDGLGKRNLWPGAPFVFLMTIFNISEMELQHRVENHNDNNNNFTIQLRPFYFTYSLAQIAMISAVFAVHFHWFMLFAVRNSSNDALGKFREHTQEAP